MRITNGWYEWVPNEDCQVPWLDCHQIVQVIEKKVWATFVAEEVSVSEAKKQGEFLRKIELSKL